MKKSDKELVDKLLEASNKISEQTRRGYGRYLVVPPKIAETVENYYKAKERDNTIEEILKDEDEKGEDI